MHPLANRPIVPIVEAGPTARNSPQFFDECDVVTYEFENVETDLLFELQQKKPLMPSAAVLSTTQNRGREKGLYA